MKIGIIGSRKRTDKQAVYDLVKMFSQNDIVVSGGCVGPDTWAEEAARSAELDVLIFLPALPHKGSPRHEFTKAFYARNRLIAENSDILYAFVSPDRKGGTEHTIKHAEKLGKKVFIIQP
uniref:DUF2493 domain-containing protein n=1 Tax=Candidatus Desulfatibia profunda TaxID=2841695 RepID=A0A8J6NUI6_9BACT|nr:hypothetical protein [Candidatus Desulfatibia profunda]